MVNSSCSGTVVIPRSLACLQVCSFQASFSTFRVFSLLDCRQICAAASVCYVGGTSVIPVCRMCLILHRPRSPQTGSLSPSCHFCHQECCSVKLAYDSRCRMAAVVNGYDLLISLMAILLVRSSFDWIMTTTLLQSHMLVNRPTLPWWVFLQLSSLMAVSSIAGHMVNCYSELAVSSLAVDITRHISFQTTH